MHPELTGFPVVIELDVAWGEMDSYGHVNNVVYFRYFENARIPYLDQIGWTKLRTDTGHGPILHSTSARYRKPITYPDRLTVGARIRHLQPDRVTFEYRLLSQKWSSIAAEGEAIIVSYDYQSAAKCAIPVSVLSRIQQLQPELFQDPRT